MATQDSKLVMNITAALNSSQLAKDMQNVREAIERGAKGIDNILGASKAKGMKSFSDLIKSAETFAVTLDSLSKRSNPFKNVIDSLTGVSNKIQQVTGQLSQLSNMKIAPTVTLGAGTSLDPASKNISKVAEDAIKSANDVKKVVADALSQGNFSVGHAKEWVKGVSVASGVYLTKGQQDIIVKSLTKKFNLDDSAISGPKTSLDNWLQQKTIENARAKAYREAQERDRARVTPASAHQYAMDLQKRQKTPFVESEMIRQKTEYEDKKNFDKLNADWIKDQKAVHNAYRRQQEAIDLEQFRAEKDIHNQYVAYQKQQAQLRLNDDATKRKLQADIDKQDIAAQKSLFAANQAKKKIETEVQKTVGGATRYAPLTTQQIIEARTGVGRQGKSAFESAQIYMKQKYEDLEIERRQDVINQRAEARIARAAEIKQNKTETEVQKTISGATRYAPLTTQQIIEARTGVGRQGKSAFESAQVYVAPNYEDLKIEQRQEVLNKQAEERQKTRLNKEEQNYKKYLQKLQNEHEKFIQTEDKQARAYANSRQGQDARILGGGAKNVEELRRYAKIKTPDSDMAGFQKEVSSKLQGFGYSAEQVKNLSKELTNLHLKTNGMTQSSGFLAKAWEQQTQAISRLFRYYTSFFILSGLRADLTNAAAAAIKFKDSMLEVKKFLPEGSPLGALQSSVMPMANEYAVSMDTVLGSYAEFAKQGKAANEIVDLTRSALLGVNVASADYATVVTYLTTATNVWGYSTKETVGLIDKLAYVQAKSSAESTHLIASMQRTASMAKQFGLSLDEVLGYTAVISEKTMLPGEVIGTSMKTIIERSQRLKTLQELSKMQPFQNIQFINPFTGDMMKANDVLGLVAKSWKDLTDEQQKSVGELIAGGRQVNTFIALMENYDRALNLTKESMTSWGYATKANETEMEKFSKSWAKFRGMMIEQFGAGMFSPIIAGTQSVINWLNKGADASYGLGIAFGALVVSIVGGAGVALAFNKIMLGFQAYQTAAAAATIGTNALTAAFTALGLATPAGWIGSITAGVIAVTATYLGWTSYTQRQEQEQKNLNTTLNDTIGKLLKIQEIKDRDAKISAAISEYKAMTPETIKALNKEGFRERVSPRGPYFDVDIATTKRMRAVQAGLPQDISSDASDSLIKFVETFNLVPFEKLQGNFTDNKKRMQDFFIFLADYNDSIKEASQYYLKNYRAAAKNIYEDTSLTTLQKSLKTAQRGAERYILDQYPNETDLSIGELQRRIEKEPQFQKQYQLWKTLETGTQGASSKMTMASMLPENFSSMFIKIGPDKIKQVANNLDQMFQAIYEFNSVKPKNQATQKADMLKLNNEAIDAAISEINAKTEQSLRGTRTPKFKLEFDYAAVEVATKKYQDALTKVAASTAEIAQINQELALAKEQGFELDAIQQYEKQIESLEQKQKLYEASVVTSQNALNVLNALLVINSETASQAEKEVAKLSLAYSYGVTSISSAINILGSLSSTMANNINDFINLNSWVQTVISSLLSIPKSITVQINALFSAMGGSSIGAFAGGLAKKLFGSLIPGNDPQATQKTEDAAYEVRINKFKQETAELEKQGQKIRDNKKLYDEVAEYNQGMAQKQQELQTIWNQIQSKDISPEKRDKLKKDYRELAGQLEKAKQASQKDAGAGAAKKESEDIAHQKALEKIHQMEQQISVQKKVQSFWENQLTDTVKRRWEREIRDLKSKSATYTEMSKMAGLKPEEARQYERQARETANEAKLMEDRRGEIERQYQMEMAQKRFNRALEETNKLFEYQQQIKSLDFEMGYTTEAEQQRFQMMQQEERVQFAINQYNEIYANERNRILESIRAEQEGQGEITAEVEARIQTQLEEQMILSETVQRAKERVVEEQRATVMLEKRLRNEIFARAKQSVSEIQSTLAGAISSMFDNSAAEEKLKRIKEIMDEIAKLQQDSEFAGYNVAGAEATGSIDSINQAREKWYEVNQQMVEARKKLDEVGESTNKWKETLKSIGDTALKKISERFAEMIMDKSGLGDMLMKMFVGIDGMGRGGSAKASQGATALATILPSQLGGPLLSKAMSATLGGAGLSPTISGPTSIVVNQSGSAGGGLDLGSIFGGRGASGGGSAPLVRNAYTGRMEAAGAAAKTKTFGPINYLTAAMLGYGIGSSTNNRAVGVLGGAAAGFLTAGPIGAVLGALGGLFGRKKNEDAPPPVQPAREFYALAKNSESLDANTRALNKISEGVWGAPSVFEFNKLQAESNAPRQTFNLTVNVSGSMNRAMATEVGNTILQTVSQGMSQSAPRTATVSTANWG